MKLLFTLFNTAIIYIASAQNDGIIPYYPTDAYHAGYHFRYGRFIREDIKFEKGRYNDTLAIFIADSVAFHKKNVSLHQISPHLCQNRFYKFGYMGVNGKELIPFKYDGIQDKYDSSIMHATINKFAGIIDGKGKRVIPFKYNSVYVIDDTLFAVANRWRDSTLKFYNRKFEYLFSAKGCVAEQFSNNYIRMSFINAESVYTTSYIISKQGKIILTSLKNGVIWIEDSFICSYRNSKLGIIDFKNKVIVPFEYNDIKVGCKNQFIIYKNNKSGIINSNNQAIIPLGKTRIRSFANSYFIENMADSTAKIIKPNGQTVLSGHYRFEIMNHMDNYDKIITNDLLIIENTDNRLKGIYSTKGVELLPIEYDFIFTHRSFNPCASIIIYKKTKSDERIYQYTLMNKNGKIIIPLADNALNFVDENPNLLYSINKNKLIALVNANTGQLLTPYDYEYSCCENKLSDGYLAIKKNYRYALVSPEGKILTEALYSNFYKKDEKNILWFDEDIVCLGRRNEKLYGITKDGKELVIKN